MTGKKKSNAWWGTVLLAFASGAIIAGLLFNLAAPAAVTLARDARAELNPIERSTVDVFQRVSPSVVNVSNIAQRRTFLSYDAQEIPQGSGTGVVWDKQGHILTNFHVIFQADTVGVTFSGDQTMRRAKVVGVAPHKDLAVLAIDPPPDNLVPIVPGSSSDLLVGQSVLAIGNPFGLDHTLTTGVVSALGREIKAITGRTIQDVIQTDAAINPGNSGGPLLDSQGRLIGVNTAIYSPSGSSAGIGFAVPVDTVKSIVNQLIEHGKVVRPGLGILPFDDAQVARWKARLNLKGVIVRSVERRSAASRAGLRGTQETEDGDVILGDVITAIDGKKINCLDDLFMNLERRKVGEEVEVTYLRVNEDSGRNKPAFLERKAKVTLQTLNDGSP